MCSHGREHVPTFPSGASQGIVTSVYLLQAEQGHVSSSLPCTLTLTHGQEASEDILKVPRELLPPVSLLTPLPSLYVVSPPEGP